MSKQEIVCPGCQQGITIEVSKGDPEGVAERVLGATPVEETKANPNPEWSEMRVEESRLDTIVGKAQTSRKEQLDRQFRPSHYGFTMEDFQRMFPLLDAKETLERFFAYHIPRGDRSLNWMQEFLGYATYWLQKAKESQHQDTQHGVSENFAFDPKS